MTSKNQSTSLIAFMNAYSVGTSGGDAVLLHLVKGLGLPNTTLVTSSLGQKLAKDEGLRCNYLLTDSSKSFTKPLVTYLKRTLQALTALGKLTLTAKTVILCGSDAFPDVVPAIVLKHRHPQTRLVAHIYHLVPKTRLLPHLLQLVSLILLKRSADALVVDNMQLSKALVHSGFPRRKLHLNYPGIPPLPKLSVHKKHGSQALFVGQLRPSKGIYDLPVIWHEVLKHCPKAHLSIVGTGQHNHIIKLTKLINRYKLTGSVTLLGFVTHAKLTKLMASSTLLVHPSHEEGFGITPLTAQSFGLPVVAWRLPVYSELFLQGMVKISRSKQHMALFAQSIVKLFTQPSYTTRLSRQARTNSSRFSWQATIAREREILKQL